MSAVPISVICPSCYNRFRGSTKVIGRKGRCACGKVFRVTGARCTERIFEDPAELEARVRLFMDVYDTARRMVGGTVGAFRAALAAVPNIDQWRENGFRHKDLVFRHICRSIWADRDGRLLQSAGLGHWAFRTVGEPCGLCGSLADKVFSVADRKYCPPLHWGCHCYAAPVFNGQAATDRLTRSYDLSSPEYERQQERPGAFRRPEIPLPAERDLSRKEVLDHWAEFARQFGWELTADPGAANGS